jgi:thiamine transporter ThiT
MSTSSSTVTAVRPSLGLGDLRLYLVTAAMVLGNLALPWAVHRIPDAGRMLLPIFFFTLVAGWRFGAKAGVLTGVVSPLANHLLTGMPPAPALQGIILQSALLGLLAAGAGARDRRPALGWLAGVVLAGQAVMLLPVLVQSGAAAALAGFRLHLAGILLQVLGGYGVLRLLAPAREDRP